MVLAFLQRLDEDAGGDVLAQKTPTFLKTKCAELVALVKRTEQLARQLQAQSMEFVLCHSDLHAGNIFIGARGALYIVDWDNPIVAPKERDLMYAGGGQFGGARTPQQEEILFYAGYGQTELDRVALAYYRYERIIEDIAVECAQIFSPHIGILDREQEFEYVQSNFLPNGVLELARASDKMYGL